MSFLSGAECSTSGNPLGQFTKHVHDDKTLQRDRLVGPASSDGAQGFRSTTGAVGRQDEMMNSFLHASPALPELPLAAPRDFGPQLRIDRPLGLPVRAESASPRSWAEDFRNGQPAASAESPQFANAAGTPLSPAEFARFQHLNQSSSSRSSPMPSGVVTATPATQAYRNWMAPGLANGSLGYGGLHHPMYQAQMYPQAPAQQQQHEPEGKGKGKAAVVELDDSKWEEQFAQIELEDKQVAQGVVEDAAIEAELDKMDEKMMESETGFGDLESIWQGIQAGKAELGEFADFDSPYGLDWNSRLGADPMIEPYLFEEENVFKDSRNAYAEGVRIMDEGGNLSLAALAFEAAVQQKPDHVEAWLYLGSAQAQNEKEDAAIRALEHALKLDPNNPAALMGLAVSYTNEGYDSTAYRTLERWLSVMYPQIISPMELSSAADLGFTDRQQLHDKVTNLFIRAAQLSPGGEHMDPDVQVGLGVLFYGAEDYDKAVDCFTAALASSEQGSSNQRSQIHLLWNRLGATLANSGRSEDAIAAYEKALALRPNFVRARYNLGVSCINIGCHEAAAGHLLAAISMHRAVLRSAQDRVWEILGEKNPPHTPDDATQFLVHNHATTLHETLRRVFMQMRRPDLAVLVTKDMDLDTFRREFDF